MSDFKRVSVAEASQLIIDKSPLIVDVRDENAYRAGALPDAIHVTMSSFRIFRRNSNQDRPVLIYCYHGNASQDMAQMFVDFGFNEVYSMDGGYEAWRLVQ